MQMLHTVIAYMHIEEVVLMPTKSGASCCYQFNTSVCHHLLWWQINEIW